MSQAKCMQREKESDYHQVSYIIMKQRIWAFFSSMGKISRMFLLWEKYLRKTTTNLCLCVTKKRVEWIFWLNESYLFLKLVSILCLLLMGYPTNILFFLIKRISAKKLGNAQTWASIKISQIWKKLVLIPLPYFFFVAASVVIWKHYIRAWPFVVAARKTIQVTFLANRGKWRVFWSFSYQNSVYVPDKHDIQNQHQKLHWELYSTV